MQSVLGSLLVFSSLCVVVFGLLGASQATFGVALVGTAVYIAVLGRIAQAERFQTRMLDLTIEANKARAASANLPGA